MESLRHYLVVALVILLSLAGVAHAQVPALVARSLSLASPPNTIVPFASLSNSQFVPQVNGTITYCSDCNQTPVCAAGGTGAIATLVNNAWQCGLGTSQTGTVSINPGQAGQLGGYAVNGSTISPMTAVQGISVNGSLNVKAYGAKGDYIYSGDGVHLADGTTGGSAFSSPSGAFTSALVGDVIEISGAGTAGGIYSGTVTGFTSATALTVSPATSTAVSGSAYYAIGFDNSAAFASAVTAATGVQSMAAPIAFPPGRYLWNTASAFAFGKSRCNVNLVGASQGGSILVPNFSGADATHLADAVAFVDPAAEIPPSCDGAIRHLAFLAPPVIPLNLNLIRVSNEQGITIDHVSAGNRSPMAAGGFNPLFQGINDSTIYLDPGVGPISTTWTEQVKMSAVTSFFTTNMLTLDGKGLAASSLNNETMTLSHCDPGGTGAHAGACINMQNWVPANIAMNSSFGFNADISGAGQSVIKATAANDLQGQFNFDIYAQNPNNVAASCFNAPASSGSWLVEGNVHCIGGSNFVQEAHGNPVNFVPFQQGTSLNNWTFRGTHAVAASGPAATLVSCGTSPTIAAGSTDAFGEITIGSGAPTQASCILHFGTPWSANYACNFTAEQNPVWFYTSAKTGAQIQINGGNCPSGNCANQPFMYACFGVGGT
jgi:hypothetical protein